MWARSLWFHDNTVNIGVDSPGSNIIKAHGYHGNLEVGYQRFVDKESRIICRYVDREVLMVIGIICRYVDIVLNG